MGIQSIIKTYQLIIEIKQATKMTNFEGFLIFLATSYFMLVHQEKGNGRLSNVALVVVTETPSSKELSCGIKGREELEQRLGSGDM